MLVAVAEAIDRLQNKYDKYEERVLIIAREPAAKAAGTDVSSVTASVLYTVDVDVELTLSSGKTWSDLSTFTFLQAVTRLTNMESTSVRTFRTTLEGDQPKSGRRLKGSLRTATAVRVDLTLAISDVASALNVQRLIADSNRFKIVVQLEATKWSDPLLSALNEIQHRVAPTARPEITLRVAIDSTNDAAQLEKTLNALKQSTELARALSLEGLKLHDDYAISADGTKVSSTSTIPYTTVEGTSKGTNEKNASKNEKLGVEAIVGIAAGGAVAIALTISASVYYFCTKESEKDKPITLERTLSRVATMNGSPVGAKKKPPVTAKGPSSKEDVERADGANVEGITSHPMVPD